MNDRSKYEYFCGFDKKKKPIWTRNFGRIKPIFEWNNHCGCVTITYNAALKKYIMCITDGWPTLKYMDTYFLESNNVEGPWKMVTYMERFGEQGYFVNIPTKFISDGGRRFWLSYSGNFATFNDLKVNPPGGRYGFILQEMKFLSKEELKSYPTKQVKTRLTADIENWQQNNPLTCDKNLALQAKVEASSVHSAHTAEAVIDGVIGGYPHNPENEWASDQETVGAKIRLTWENEINVSKIWLFDRPSHNEHILKGELTLSAGTKVPVGKLPNAEYAGKEIRFPAKKITWVEFTVLGVGRSKNIGLAEIAIFE